MSWAVHMLKCVVLFFLNDTATTEIYTLSLHDALPIWRPRRRQPGPPARPGAPPGLRPPRQGPPPPPPPEPSLTCSRTTVPGGASVPALGDWPTTRPAGALLCTVCAEAL